MIIFHQFFLPDLYYYPTSSNLAKTHAHIISQRSSPLPLLGWVRRWSEPEKKRWREMKREGILSGRAAVKSLLEGRSFNGNGRSVLQEGLASVVGPRRSAALCIYI